MKISNFLPPAQKYLNNNNNKKTVHRYPSIWIMPTSFQQKSFGIQSVSNKQGISALIFTLSSLHYEFATVKILIYYSLHGMAFIVSPDHPMPWRQK